MILSIDTFSDILGIAVLDENKEHIVFLNYKKPKPFSEILIQKIDEIFKEYSISKNDLKAVVVNKGPGTYTGLRIGITTAKVLSYAMNIPLYTYESLYAMAYKYKYFSGTILSAVYAGKGEVYLRKFLSKNGNIQPLTENLLIKRKELESFLKNVDLVVEKNLNLKNAEKLTESLSLAGAFFAFKQNNKENPFTVEPVYLRDN